MTTSEKKWEDLYGEVMWVKCGSFPWWPSYLFDPSKINPAEDGYTKAQKTAGKMYCCLFLDDRTLGFVYPKDMKPFNSQTIAELSKQKISNKSYQLQIPRAIEEATRESALPKSERLRWYYDRMVQSQGSEEEEQSADSVQDDNSDSGSSSDEEEASIDNDKNRKRPLPDLESEEEQEPSSEESESEESASNDSGDDDGIRRATAKPKRLQKASEPRPVKKRRLMKKSVLTEEDASDDEGVAVTKKSAPKPSVSASTARRGRPPSVKPETSPKPAVPPAAPRDESRAQLFAEESRIDRLSRLAGILELTTSVSTLDEQRALKTLDKIREISGLTVLELKESGLAKVVVGLKSSSKNATIRSKSSDIVAAWSASGRAANESTSVAAAAALGRPPSIAKQASEAKPPVFKVELVSRSSNSACAPPTAAATVASPPPLSATPRINSVTPTGTQIITAASNNHSNSTGSSSNNNNNLNSSSSNSRHSLPSTGGTLTVALERERAERLFSEVVSDAHLARELEQLLYTHFESVSVQYLEAVTRIFFALKTNALGNPMDTVRNLLHHDGIANLATGGAFSHLYTPYHLSPN